MHVAAAGDRALLITIPGASSLELRGAAEALRRVPGVVAAIVGHESVYAIGIADSAAAERALAASAGAAPAAVAHHRIEVSFREDYALDLPELLARTGLSREEFLARAGDVRLSARYLGFRAGWAYLDGWPAEWAIPRRPTSRDRVPRGSFAVAGTMAGFYPDDGPGGWNILGRTDAPLRFTPGDEIEIVPVMREIALPPRPKPQPDLDQFGEVIARGQLTTVVHAPDWSRLDRGLPEGGPFDPGAAAVANEAAGNAPDAPLLECVLVGPTLRLEHRSAFCDGDLNVRTFPPGVVEVGRIRGMRGYLAVGTGAAKRLRSDLVRRDSKIIRALAGPHDAPPLAEEWVVTPQLDRVGVRLRPMGRIEAKPPGDLPSLGTQFGTLQWHPDGSLVALGPEHPVTGGYLQPATVPWEERWKLAQLAPGDRIRVVVSR